MLLVTRSLGAAPKDMYLFECTNFTFFYILTFISTNGNLIKL